MKTTMGLSVRDRRTSRLTCGSIKNFFDQPSPATGDPHGPETCSTGGTWEWEWGWWRSAGTFGDRLLVDDCPAGSFATPYSPGLEGKSSGSAWNQKPFGRICEPDWGWLRANGLPQATRELLPCGGAERQGAALAVGGVPHQDHAVGGGQSIAAATSRAPALTEQVGMKPSRCLILLKSILCDRSSRVP